MPLLTVVNLTTGPIPLQDPSGMSTFSQKVPGSGTLGPISVTLDQLAHLEPQLIKEATASNITWTVAVDPASAADQLPAEMKVVLVTPADLVATDTDVLTNLTSPGAVSVVLSAAAPIGKNVRVVDQKGDAGTNNITVTVASSGTINGGANDVISTNNGVAHYLKTGTTAWTKV